MIKSVIAQNLSLRCKFKSANRVEVCIIDSRTNDTFMYWIDFRDNKVQEVIEERGESHSAGNKRDEEAENDE